VAPRAALERHEPDSTGGGTVRLASSDRVVWADLPARQEAGTPNVVGAVALARAIRSLQAIGMDRLAEHDRTLREQVVRELGRIPGVHIYSQPVPADRGAVGVVGFRTQAMGHGLLAAALGHEWGIGVRHGCFCAHPYVTRLLGLQESDLRAFAALAERNDHRSFPGLVRISLGLYNTPEEVSYAARAIRSVLEHGPRARYAADPPTGEHLPLHAPPDLERRFKI